MKWKPKKEYKVIQGTKLVETNEESGTILKNSGVKHNRWNLVKLGDVVKINPRRKLTRTREAVHVAMRDIEGHKRETTSHSYKKFSGSGARFQNGDTLFARITPCLENGKTAYVSCLKPNQVAHGSTEFIVLSGIEGKTDNLFVYYLARDPNYQFALPPEKIRCLFDLIAEPLFAKIESNENESRTLAQIRDTLLPKLLSGEIRVDDASEILEVKDGEKS